VPPADRSIKSIHAKGATVEDCAHSANARELTLEAGRTAKIAVSFE